MNRIILVEFTKFRIVREQRGQMLPDYTYFLEMKNGKDSLGVDHWHLIKKVSTIPGDKIAEYFEEFLLEIGEYLTEQKYEQHSGD